MANGAMTIYDALTESARTSDRGWIHNISEQLEKAGRAFVTIEAHRFFTDNPDIDKIQWSDESTYNDEVYRLGSETVVVNGIDRWSFDGLEEDDGKFDDPFERAEKFIEKIITEQTIHDAFPAACGLTLTRTGGGEVEIKLHTWER